MQNLQTLFSNIATAIRSKTGRGGTIIASNFPSEIETIITPNQQTKNINVTHIGQTVTYDADYNGLSRVTIADVSSSVDPNILEQGSGGSGEGIKQFASVEEMNATTGEEGDLAVVYSAEISSFTADSEAQTVKFPNVVILHTPFTDMCYTMLRSTGTSYFDAQLELYPEEFRFMGWGDSNEVRIEYTSDDGVTYTRTDGGEELVDFGTPVKCSYPEEWNDMLGYFMQIESCVFEGLFNYTSSNWENASTQLTATADDVYKKICYSKDGVVSGTLTKNTELTKNELKKRVELYSTFSNLTTSETNLVECFKDMPITKVPMIDTSNVTSMNYMFYGCTQLVDVPLLNTSSVTSMAGLFQGCESLEYPPELDTSKNTVFSNFFTQCSSLEFVPYYDMTSCTHASAMFSYCYVLKEIPQFNTANVTSLGSFALNCISLTSFPQLNTSKCNDFSYLCRGCTQLRDFPVLDMSGLGQYGACYGLFTDCPHLTDDSLNNIMLSLASAVNYTNTTYRNLAKQGLTEEQVNRCKTLSNYSTFINAGWTAGY